jgi:2-oxoglutarate dehydrogenase E1 component
VDIVCFRKLGHNEQDTPSLTQPLMYKKIAQHPGTRKLYADRLETIGVIRIGEGDEMVKGYRADMDAGTNQSSPVISNYKGKFAVDWSAFLNKKWTDDADTSVPAAELSRLAERITTIPPDFKVHPLVEKVLTDRRAMGKGEMNLDWGMGEHLAYASLLASGYAVRIDILSCMIRTAKNGTPAPIFRCKTLLPGRGLFWSSTPYSPKRRCWDLSMVIQQQSRMRW